MSIKKVFEVDSYYNKIEEQIKPIIEQNPARILIPDFSTAKYDTVRSDGRSFGYPADYGTFVTLEYKEFMGIIADDILALLKLNAQKTKEANALDLDFTDYFDEGDKADKPEKFEIIVDTKNDWMIKTDGGDYLYRSICPYDDVEVFRKIDFDDEEYSNEKEVVDDILDAQKFRNGIIRDANKALLDAKEMIAVLEKSVKGGE